MNAPSDKHRALQAYIEETSLVNFEHAGITYDTDLFAAAVLDSYGMIEVALFLEKELGLKLTDEAYLDKRLSTVNGMIELAVASAGAGAGR